MLVLVNLIKVDLTTVCSHEKWFSHMQTVYAHNVLIKCRQRAIVSQVGILKAVIREGVELDYCDLSLVLFFCCVFFIVMEHMLSCCIITWEY